MSGVAGMRPQRKAAVLVRSAGVVAAIRGLDFGLSFLVSVLLAHRFGASGQLDAFFLARRTTVGFADMIRKLVGQVVLPPVLAAVDAGRVPTLAHLPRRLTWFLGAFALLMLAGMIVPEQLVALFAPGFRGEQVALTATMMRIMMPLLPIAVLASLLATVLQARRKYLISEGTNMVQRAVLVLVLALFVPPLGIIAGAWTMLVAGVIGFAILLAGAWSIVRPRGGAPVEHERPIQSAGGGLAAAIVLNVYLQGTSLLDFAFASTTIDGGVAALEYGSRLVSLVPGLVMSSLATVLTPELVRAVQSSNRASVAGEIQRFQRIALFAQVPVSVGMMLGGTLIVSVLFGHGAFGADAIAAAAACTAGYAAAAIFLAPMTAITTAIYADPHSSPLRDLTIIAIAGLAIRAVTLAIATPLAGVEGVAWGAALATALAFVVAEVIAVRRFHHFRLGAQLSDLARTLLCGGLAAAAGVGLLWLLPTPHRLYGELALLALLGATVVAAYGLAALMLRVPEVAALRDVAKKVIGKRRGKRA